jgi:hypothetical protein
MKTKSPQISDKRNELHGVLDFVHDTFVQGAIDAKDSKIFLELGVKNETATFWENIVSNPINMLKEMGDSVDSAFLSIVNEAVKSYLTHHKKLVSKAYITNPLHYCIVLKSDTSKNRMEINRFFPSYNELTFAHKYPVAFQFIPKEIAEKLVFKQAVV